MGVYEKETEFLGHIVTTEGIKPNPNKIKAIQKFPLPKTTKKKIIFRTLRLLSKMHP